MTSGLVSSAPAGVRPVSLSGESERQYTSEVGMTVFLGSWAMMFAALFFSYALLRARSSAWPPEGVPTLPLGLPLAATAVILGSSVWLHAGIARFRSVGRGLVLALAGTALLGTLFLGAQVATWLALWQAGLRPAQGVYASVFYLLTIFHSLHVVVGLGLLAARMVPAGMGRTTPDGLLPVRLVARFWHFIGVVWLVTFASVYLV